MQDNYSEPVYLTNVTQGRNQYSRRQLLGAKIKLSNHELIALVDSGCEVEIVLSRRFSDKIGVNYSLITREFSLPDGTRMTAARTSEISLGIAGYQKDLTAVVVDMVPLTVSCASPG
jgi:hypothetical protein